MKELNVKALFDAIKAAVQENGLDWKYCVAQCYDGATVTSGPFSGVQARILELAPHVLYVHCLAHRLNLVLVATVKNIAKIS